MLDVKDFIIELGGDPEKIKESQRRRYVKDGEKVVDEVIELYQDHRKAQYAVTQVATKGKEVQKQIGAKLKAKEKADDLLAQKAELEKERKGLEESAKEKEAILRKTRRTIGNYIHDSVPVNDNEDFNPTLRTWAPKDVKVEKRDDFLSHHEVLLRLDGYEPERGAKVAGHRGYYLTGWGQWLNMALQMYGQTILHGKGYKVVKPPTFMNKDLMALTAQLEQFDEELYKVVQDSDPKNDKYAIATSEQPISAMHSGEWLQAKDLPIKYAGASICFRKEAGSHGRDAWGIFRVHEFEKVEQFVITDPEKSWEAFEDMIGIAEDFYKSLGVPYRVVEIVSGAFNNSAAKKYDLEAWFPFQGEYKELVSCSNCTDYQSRDLEIRFGIKLQTDIQKKYVHMLNCTLCATERALCCLLENFQGVNETEDGTKVEGFHVPEPLRRYLPGEPDFLPFTKELPKDSTSQKVKGKAPKPKGAAGAGGAKEAGDKLKDLKV
ncbi:Seryl-tRNA synthetase [Hyphodiscus hymeniophilus]|uniref:serine--tRNA ligase n=1 Tax=Hyphodiscus hymeniophilus TaxID=353542 RepID=A0A9P7AWH6_9HELO|nr:Seryl-tRNA synthetase [Hyphodiscus hymeniophilus]